MGAIQSGGPGVVVVAGGSLGTNGGSRVGTGIPASVTFESVDGGTGVTGEFASAPPWTPCCTTDGGEPPTVSAPDSGARSAEAVTRLSVDSGGCEPSSLRRRLRRLAANEKASRGRMSWLFASAAISSASSSRGVPGTNRESGGAVLLM